MTEAAEAEAAKRRMRENAGDYLLPELEEYAELDPDLFNVYLELRECCVHDETVGSRNHKLLMAVAVLISQKQVDPARLYAEQARREGATAAELLGALRVGILFSGGPGILAASVVAKEFASD
jgi:alkylhydroperoxidase/carboxymuconolactone decarboxylase family protein YurZ